MANPENHEVTELKTIPIGPLKLRIYELISALHYTPFYLAITTNSQISKDITALVMLKHLKELAEVKIKAMETENFLQCCY